MAIKDWKRTVNDELVFTGGGMNYYITFYRNKNDPKKQIELIQDTDEKDRKISSFFVNIGKLDKKTDDLFEWIDGDYYTNETFRSKKKALEFIKNYMKKN